MADQERKQTRPDQSTQGEEATDTDTAPVGEALTDRIDDLLDEIDTVLEENAEEFVKNYVQKGGQ